MAKSTPPAKSASSANTTKTAKTPATKSASINSAPPTDSAQESLFQPTIPLNERVVDLSNPYQNLNLHELEEIMNKLKDRPASKDRDQELTRVRQTLRQRQRQLKAHVMEFEQSNDHYLLVFDSTDGFSKIAGRSVLFYSMTIADRIHRRFNVKNDSDHYSRSDEGIIALRHLDDLISQLANINIFPDRQLSTAELHFFRLAKIYTDEQIEKLRDRSKQDIERITSIVLPRSPMPLLHDAIMRVNFMIYHSFKRMSDTFAREVIGQMMLKDAHQLTLIYLDYASSRNTHPAETLFELITITRRLKSSMANVQNLRLIHHREICHMLEALVDIDRLASKAYRAERRRQTATVEPPLPEADAITRPPLRSKNPTPDTPKTTPPPTNA